MLCGVAFHYTLHWFSISPDLFSGATSHEPPEILPRPSRNRPAARHERRHRANHRGAATARAGHRRVAALGAALAVDRSRARRPLAGRGREREAPDGVLLR